MAAPFSTRNGARSVVHLLLLALQVPAILSQTISLPSCPPEECPDDMHCWNTTRSVIHIGWGYRNFGVCLSEENCGLIGEPDTLNFTYQLNPVIVQKDDVVLFHSIEDDLVLDLRRVSRDNFNQCNSHGFPLQDFDTKGVELDAGMNYFIHRGRPNSVYNCDFGLKVRVLAKTKNCGDLGPYGLCSGHGVCASYPHEEYSTCHCCEGYEGQDCQVAVDLCSNSPCLNGGACYVNQGRPRCRCKREYSGEFCQNPIRSPMVTLSAEPSVQLPVTEELNLPSQCKDGIHGDCITIQTYLPDLNCQFWEGNDTLEDVVKEELYRAIQTNLIPSALGHCSVSGAHYSLNRETLQCFRTHGLFRVNIVSSQSSSIPTKDIVCIISYYLRNSTVFFDVLGELFQVATHSPLFIYSLNDLNCDDARTEWICFGNETITDVIDINEAVTTTNSTYIPPEGAVYSKYSRMGLISLILCIMIPICLLLMIIMALGLLFWKKKYTKSYTFEENIKLAKLGKLEGRPRSMDLETQMKRKDYLYGIGTMPMDDEVFERQRNASGSTSTAPVQDNEIDFKPTRTRVDSGTSTIRSSKGSDVRRISDEYVKIINVKPTDDANGEAHGYENKAFHFVDDDQSADSAIEDIQSV
ncbi:uncharacterized protein [Ptychodera flava]|uniref:uncharacterized protein isoform X2 n=1 Tax=Ptychodera flava TaxID=63121 RepID=UPI00396A559A